jgi:acyl-CoA thioesterase-1
MAGGHSIGRRDPIWHPPAVRYVALGDSYTIGTSVAEGERWPNQLVARMGRSDAGTAPALLELAANLAVNGFTSADVIEVALPALAGLDAELVSLLIGVNDVVQGVPPERYRRNAEQILEELAALVGAHRVVAVTTPDYTVTPAGADYGDPARQAARIRAVNQGLDEAATHLGIAVVDIHELSLRASSDRSLVANDGLHPSGTQYSLWVDRIAPAVTVLMGRTR